MLKYTFYCKKSLYKCKIIKERNIIEEQKLLNQNKSQVNLYSNIFLTVCWKINIEQTHVS